METTWSHPPLDSDIKHTESVIADLESREVSDSVVATELSRQYSRFASLHRHNSLRWAQRAHLLWLHDGDHNTAFFHNSVRIQSHFNSISQVTDFNGNVVSEFTDIELAFTQFYSNLWSNTCDSNFFNTLDSLSVDLPSLTDAEGCILTKEVTREDIYQVVVNLPSGKCPGPDGFNAEFYKFFWNDIGDSLVSAVNYFFTNSVMPNS